MAATNVLRRDESLLMPSPIDPRSGDASISRGLSLEKKIEALESLTGQVSNRRSRRWLSDRILMELVPRLDAQEIRGLFAPPPWGDDVPPSAFSLTNVGEWDKFRNIDMDKEANIMDSLNHRSSVRQKGHVDADKTAVLNAWRIIDCRTGEALPRSFLPENCKSHFIEEGGEGDVLELKVQDPFHRLLLHGVCEHYHNLVSVTATEQIGKKATKTTRISWKNGGDAGGKPNISDMYPTIKASLDKHGDEKAAPTLPAGTITRSKAKALKTKFNAYVQAILLTEPGGYVQQSSMEPLTIGTHGQSVFTISIE